MSKKKKNKKDENKIAVTAIAAFIVICMSVYSAISGSGALPDAPVTVGTTAVVEPNTMVVSFIDIGQGDASLIQTRNGVILIDGGDYDKTEEITQFLNKAGITKIDYVIATHPHSDHIGTLATVIDGYAVENVIMPKVTHTSKSFEEMVLAVQSKNLQAEVPVVGKTYELDGISFQILAPSAQTYEDLNNYSIAVRVVYGENSFLFTGDAEKLAEDEILDTGYNIKSNVLQVGHHGSNTSSSVKFLEAVDPEIAVISVGADNSYGHPTDTILERFKAKNVQIFRTDLDGTVTIMSDGRTLSVIKEK